MQLNSFLEIFDMSFQSENTQIIEFVMSEPKFMSLF